MSQIKAVSVETQVDTERREVTAYASVFGNRDRIGDIVHPGAFSKTLKDGPFAHGRVAYKYNHRDLIGRPISAVEDSKGLLTVSRVSKTPLGDEKLELMRDGSLSTYSFRYDAVTKSTSVDREGTRHLRELKLFEFGPVDPDIACNPAASVIGVKGEILELPDIAGAVTDFLRTLQVKGDLTTEEIRMLKSIHAQFEGNTQMVKALLDLSTPLSVEAKSVDSMEPATANSTMAMAAEILSLQVSAQKLRMARI